MLFNSAKFLPSSLTLYPLIWLSVCFTFGIVISSRLSLDWRFLTISCASVASLTIIFVKQRFTILLVFLLFILLGALCFQVERLSVSPNSLRVLYDTGELVSGELLELTGVSEGKPEPTIGGLFLNVRAEKILYKKNERETAGKVRIFAPFANDLTAQEYEQRQIGHGTKIKIACQLRREDRFLNLGVASAKEILDAQGIDALCTLKSPLLLENLGEIRTFPPLAWIYEQRQNLLLEFKRHFSVSTADVLIASLLGNRYHLDKTTAESFREGGTFHILVISGLQITFIGGLIVLVIRRFTKNQLWQFALANLLLWSYAVAVGADAPVVRAALMFTVLHFSFVIYRQGTLLNALGAAALMILVWQPSQLFNQSFQLTFMCVSAIVAMGLPLLEKLEAIGEWHPTIETPVPPKVQQRLKNFCEIMYWSEAKWQKELSRNVWQCVLFKNPKAEKLERLRLQKPLRYIFETLLVSVIVQIWLLPFSVVYFHRISLISIFLNVWVGLLMAIESLTALVGVSIAQFSEIFAAPFIWATEILNWITLSGTVRMIDSNWSSLRIPHYAGTGRAFYFLYFLPLAGLAWGLHNWQPFRLTKIAVLRAKRNDIFNPLDYRFLLKSSFALLGVLTCIIVFHPFSEATTNGMLRVDFLDVGQGDSALITMPNGETLLVDGGGRANFNKFYVIREGEETEIFEPDIQNIGETVVSRFLWARGFDKIDYLLATHADTDHIQGLIDVAKNFKITSAIVGGTPADDNDFADFRKVLSRKNIPLVKVSRGDVLSFDDVKLEILHPLSDNSPVLSENNNSIVFRLIYGDLKILMTGDIEKETERALLGAPELLQSNIVKVAHHGSKTSSISEFVSAVKAKAAVISVGRESPFGHPKPEIVNRWKASGAKVMTTGEKGTITLLTDGKQVSIETFIK